MKALGPVGERIGNLLGGESRSYTVALRAGVDSFTTSAVLLFVCVFRGLYTDAAIRSPAYKQPLLYNAAVGRELLKQVYIAERLQPPTSWATVQSAYRQLWAK